ncbi:uncharacterized protein LAESUDRAFT_732687 [Laetiporus sulphureus 93-53]|uniref:RING-14 protein n=1 Tax=Laetiporus sulphureus 93-53 TaxID=1314785 RepID=A0A165B0K3_9APHY|nr:uncharacterized protein LAESUDRAFT_732687 [Laetiporus sulphureus 93-53]KZT00002.1 hypothetical protein LAESUDRAFT_732687 [Laetiporus sulphureus 93-53]
MHFSKTYQQILLTLPAELRDSAIEYRKLKKLINQVVGELTELGLSPEVLHEVLQPGNADLTTSRTIRVNEQDVKVVYELSNVADHIEPRLRLLVEEHDPDVNASSSVTIDHATSPDAGEDASNAEERKQSEDLGATGRVADNADIVTLVSPSVQANSESMTHELIIPLVSDTAFFQLLTQALEYLSMRLVALRLEFEANLKTLSRTISLSARPMSSMSSFRPYSPHDTHPASVSVHTPSHTSKSDLYAWREVFQLYVDADIFESHQECSRGERTIEDAEARLVEFLKRLDERGFTDGSVFKVKQSVEALQTFIHLLTFIFDLRKFQHATTEATRKILKKHAKRTALPLSPTFYSPFAIPDPTSSPSLSIIVPSAQSRGSEAALISKTSVSLSHLLGQAIGETILPIIPHIDDYSCLICTNIAFKPIRLACRHLFCVRCLVKMQKRGQDHCPMCRAPTVLAADRSNVDWALLNFMKDWFPIESKKKLRQNEREVADEELAELGFEHGNCTIM